MGLRQINTCRKVPLRFCLHNQIGLILCTVPYTLYSTFSSVAAQIHCLEGFFEDFLLLRGAYAVAEIIVLHCNVY